MSQILLISDTHRDDETFFSIKEKWKNASLMIHAGDSCLEPNDKLLKNMLVVKGNHDFNSFPEYIVYPPFFICHGHTFNVYQSFDKIIEAAKKNKCRFVIHGHTHIAYDMIHEGIRIINPGSAMFNRGTYGYGTYAILDSNTEQLTFFHHQTHVPVNDIVIPDGRQTLAEFRNLLL